MRSSGDLDVDHPDPRVGGGAHGGRHQAADAYVPLAGQAAQLLLLEVVDSEDVGGHHDHHRDVEREQGANHLGKLISNLIIYHSFC